jgi:HEAT repeat protein
MVQLQIVGSLEKIGSRRAVATLMTLLRETDSSALRHTLIQALGIIGDPQAADLIRSFQDDEDYHVRKRVAAALERLSAASSDHA